MRIKREAWARISIALLFLVLLLAGLWATDGYGPPVDERSEQIILQENLKEYAIRLIGPQSGAARYYDALEIGRISESIERDHGQAAYYMASPLLQIQNGALRAFCWHAYTWLWFMAGVWALYALARGLGCGRFLAFSSCLVLYLCPRFFAEGHYNNKDMVLLSLTLLTLWLGLRLLKNPGFWRGFWFSLAGALAANTKVAGVLAWGLMGLCVVARLSARKEWTRRMAAIAAGTVGCFGLMYALMTPALWSDPFGYLGYLLQNASGFSRWTGVVMFCGEWIDQTVRPLPRIYLPYMIWATLPLYVLPLCALGQYCLARDWWKKKAACFCDIRILTLTACSLVWLLPLAYAVVSRPLVYNGWRHFYFLFGGLLPLCAEGLRRLGLALQRRVVLRRMAILFLTFLLLLNALGVVREHPYQFAYYNPFARKNADQRMDMDYWNVGAASAIERLCQERPGMLAVGAREDMSQHGLLNTYPTLSQATQARLTVAPGDAAPYLLENQTYALVYRLEPPLGYRILFQLKSYGNVIWTVYEREDAMSGKEQPE